MRDGLSDGQAEPTAIDVAVLGAPAREEPVEYEKAGLVENAPS